MSATRAVGDWQGRASVRICIEKDGRVSEPSVVKIDDPAMKPRVEKAILLWRYSPATLNGAPIRECRVVVFQRQIR